MLSCKLEAVPSDGPNPALAVMGTYLQGLIDRLEDLLATYQDLIASVADPEGLEFIPEADSHTEED